jgi:hypothetical protein
MQAALEFFAIAYTIAKIRISALGTVFWDAVFVMLAKPAKIANRITNGIVTDIHLFSSTLLFRKKR